MTTDETYGITSLPHDRASADQLLDLIRQHWRIENCLHYRRDVTLQEDGTRMSNKQQARAMAALNSFIIGLVSKLGFTNLAFAQRVFEAKLSMSLALL